MKISPCCVSGEAFRTDTDTFMLYILELTVGFDTNMQSNSDREAIKYSSLIDNLSFSYGKEQFVLLYMSDVGAMGSYFNSILFLLNNLSFDKTIQRRIIMKAMNILIRCSYYIFCRPDNPLTIQNF